MRGLQQIDRSIDLHGMYVRQAMNALERHIRLAHSARSPDVRVVHGHGSGALKAAVRDLLQDHPYVGKWRPGVYGDGGDGVTIAILDYGG
ncbi:MAG: Smr/MutS family protein [Chloroflexota bacterium]